MINIFDQKDAQSLIDRINQLSPETQAQWGKMNVAQMLAHNNVAFEMTYTDKHPKPNPIMRFMLKTFLKNTVVGPKGYAKNGRTAPAFVIADQREFDKEKQRLIDFINQTQSLGTAHFEGKEQASFGKLTAQEWSNMFTKHMDHHFKQFGV